MAIEIYDQVVPVMQRMLSNMSAILQKAEVASLDALRKPPFSIIGDPERLFQKPELDDIFELIDAIAA